MLFRSGEDKIPGHFFSEDEQPDESFLSQTCKLWEDAIQPVEELGLRSVKLRAGIVLSNEGGAFREFKKPLQFCVAAILGRGRQMISWIHIDDLCNCFIEAIENEHLSGSYNAVSPHPVTNKTLTIALAQQLRRKNFIPIHIPAFVLKMMLGEGSSELLKSVTASSSKIEAAGVTFLYPTITSALQQLCEEK